MKSTPWDRKSRSLSTQSWSADGILNLTYYCNSCRHDCARYSPQKMSFFTVVVSKTWLRCNGGKVKPLAVSLYQKSFLGPVVTKPTFQFWKACPMILSRLGWRLRQAIFSIARTPSYRGPLTISNACTLGNFEPKNQPSAYRNMWR